MNGRNNWLGLKMWVYIIPIKWSFKIFDLPKILFLVNLKNNLDKHKFLNKYILKKILDKSNYFNNIYLTFFILFSFSNYSQDDTLTRYFNKIETRLKGVAVYAFNSKNEKQRIDSNKVFIELLKTALSYSASFNYPFDSLLNDVSILTNKDKTFRIITWNLPKNDGTHVYFGYIQHWLEKDKKKEYVLHTLVDVSNTIKNSPETYAGTCDKWFGMLYYQIIEAKNYWILLGWDGNEKLIQRKFIDVLYFKKDGTPIFGKDVFKIPKKNPKRIMFQYSSDVTMTLRYEPKKDVIVFSHLSPEVEDPYMKNQYQFYGPDGSFDAFIRDKDKWKLVEDIDIRNSDDDYDKSKKPDPKKQKPLYVPK